MSRVLLLAIAHFALALGGCSPKGVGLAREPSAAPVPTASMARAAEPATPPVLLPKPSGPIKYARFEVNGRPVYGIVEGQALREIHGDVFGEWLLTETRHPISGVKFLPPTQPTKVLAVGYNYKSHLEGHPLPKVPEIFFKVPSSLIGHAEPIVIPDGTKDCHPELEMVIVMRKRAKNVEPDAALDYVLGVTPGNDVSARDWQKQDLQWWRAKGSDTFGPVGPFVASGIDYASVQMELRKNGVVKQKQTTADLVFNVPKLVSWISKHVTLEPGDLIYTGTPGKTEAMKAGDVIEVDLQGVGVLSNPVTAAKPSEQ